VTIFNDLGTGERASPFTAASFRVDNGLPGGPSPPIGPDFQRQT